MTPELEKSIARLREKIAAVPGWRGACHLAVDPDCTCSLCDLDRIEKALTDAQPKKKP